MYSKLDALVEEEIVGDSLAIQYVLNQVRNVAKTMRQNSQATASGVALLVVAVLGITSMPGYSQAAGSDYVSPADAVPKGKAPRMRVQLLNPGETTKHYAVIFYQGDEALSGLIEFAEKYQVTSAHFTAIGALSGATLGFSIPSEKCTGRFSLTVSTK